MMDDGKASEAHVRVFHSASVLRDDPRPALRLLRHADLIHLLLRALFAADCQLPAPADELCAHLVAFLSCAEDREGRAKSEVSAEVESTKLDLKKAAQVCLAKTTLASKGDHAGGDMNPLSSPKKKQP